jgi:thymidylate kinase
MERADTEMHERVARAFLEAEGEGLVHLDASQPAERVEAIAWEQLRKHLPGTAGPQ